MRIKYPYYVSPLYLTPAGNCYSACIYCRAQSPIGPGVDDLRLLAAIKKTGWYLLPIPQEVAGEPPILYHPVCRACFRDPCNRWGANAVAVAIVGSNPERFR